MFLPVSTKSAISLHDSTSFSDKNGLQFGKNQTFGDHVNKAPVPWQNI
jgi:hypothetical protein